MDQQIDDVLMGLAEFRALTHLSPSTERRMRRQEQDWPPYVEIGRKVFYFRDGVRDYLDRHRVANDVNDGGVDMAGVIARRVAELAAQAPEITPAQERWLRAIFGRREQADDPLVGYLDLDASQGRGEGHA